MTAVNIPEAQTFTVGQTDFPFVEYGERDSRRPLMLLHGISMPPTHWGEFPEELGRYTVALGLPAGKHAPAVPMLRSYSKIMAKAIHEVAGEHYDLLGLSWGGLLAQQVALDDSDGLGRLVLAGTIPAAPVPFLGMPDFTAIKTVWSAKRSPGGAAAVYGGDFRKNPELAAKFASMLDRRINAHEHARQLFAAAFSAPLVMRRMMQIEAPPTLVLAGDDDPIAPYHSAKLAAHILGVEFKTIPGGGHGFLLTRAAESAGIVNNFLDRTET